RLLDADVGDVLRLAPDVGAVEVDVGSDAAGGHGRVLGEVLRAQQSLLLGGDEADHHRAPRRLGQRLEGARDGEDLGAAGGVVAGAVVDGVAGGVRVADAEVVVVGG